MRKVLFILLAACLSLTGRGQGRDAFEEIRQDPERAGTVHYMYNHDIPAWPYGYQTYGTQRISSDEA